MYGTNYVSLILCIYLYFSFEKEIGISKHNLSQCENCIGPFFYFLLQVLQAFSDALYASPGIFSAGTFARKSKNTYFYHFAHHSKMGPYGQVCCYDLRIFCLEFFSKKNDNFNIKRTLFNFLLPIYIEKQTFEAYGLYSKL